MALINSGKPFTTAQAGDLGLTGRHLREAVASGSVRRMFRGVLVDGRVRDSLEVRAAAAGMVVPSHALACDDFAAYLFGVDTRAPGDRFDLRPTYVVAHGRTRAARPRARVRQTCIPDPDVAEVGGVRCTSPLRTASDMLRLKYRPHALAAADALARGGVLDAERLSEYVARWRRLPGLRQARELAPRVDGRAESAGESWQRCRILDAGLPLPELQVPVTDAWGRGRRLDMAWEEVRVASEYDGREFHTAPEDVAHDAERRRDLERRLGWRFWNAQFESIFGDDDTFERTLASLLGVTGVRPRQWG